MVIAALLVLATVALLQYRLARIQAAALSAQLQELQRTPVTELQRACAEFEATLRAVPDAVIRVASNGTLAPANPAAEALFRGLPSAPRRLEELPLSAKVLGLVGAALQGRSTSPGQLTLDDVQRLVVEGHERRWVARVDSVRAASGLGALLVLSDVTALVQLDQLRVDTVAVASHEFRTPLTTMRMALLMLKESAAGLSARQHDLIATALQGVEQLDVTMSEFLDLTRVEAGQLRLGWDRVHVPALVQQALRALQPQAEDARIALGMNWAEAAPEEVWADPARLRVVLSNLLGNALKYTPRGGRITVRGSAVRDPGALARTALEVSVSDTGEGIPAEFRERIFDRFFRVENSASGASGGRKGSGIGLYLTQQIIEAHGGSIRCDPGENGVGTTLAFVLPAGPLTDERRDAAGPPATRLAGEVGE